MNLLEQYIEEIHEEKPCEAEWTKTFPDKEFVHVDITTNCYGNKKRDQHIFSTDNWEIYKTQGYFMG